MLSAVLVTDYSQTIQRHYTSDVVFYAIIWLQKELSAEGGLPEAKATEHFHYDRSLNIYIQYDIRKEAARTRPAAHAAAWFASQI